MSEAQTLPPDEETFEPPVQGLVDAARTAEGASVEKGIEAWRQVAHAAPRARLPRRELARIHRGAKRWNALVESLKELVERLGDERKDEKVDEFADVPLLEPAE